MALGHIKKLIGMQSWTYLVCLTECVILKCEQMKVWCAFDITSVSSHLL